LVSGATLENVEFLSKTGMTISSSVFNWTFFGEDEAAVGSDCPFIEHGPGTNLSLCQGACANATLCNFINFNPSIGDCVFRACSNPSIPQLTSTPGYNAYGISNKPVPPIPRNDSLVALVNASTPFVSKENITFFGDSLTWLGTYIADIQAAIDGSPYTNSLGINLINRGINGGTVKDVRDGGTILGQTYPSFKEALEMDKPKLIAIQIGINDVWFPQSNHSSTLPVFEQILREDLIDVAMGSGIQVYIATVSVIGEMRDGQDPNDASLDEFAAGQMSVAAAAGIPGVDLRKAYLDYDDQYNVDDVYLGILTYDGVHPTGYGAMLLANHHAEGMLGLKQQKGH